MKRDDRVRHEAPPQWGVGRVLEDPAAGKVRIFFSNVGTKTISLLANIVVVHGADAINPILDNLKIVSLGQESLYKTLTALKQRFLNEFPGGFHGEKYQLEERTKVEAHELTKELLRAATFEGTFIKTL